MRIKTSKDRRQRKSAEISECNKSAKLHHSHNGVEHDGGSCSKIRKSESPNGLPQQYQRSGAKQNP